MALTICLIIGTIIWVAVGVVIWFFENYKNVTPSYRNGYKSWVRRDRNE